MLRGLRVFIQEYYGRRELIRQLTMRDFRARYAGSWLGLFWAISQPLAMTGILWFVFSYGLKAGPQGEVNFASWFFAANVPWLFFNEAVCSITNVYHEYAFLVKKVNFRLAILPLIKLLSATLLHLVFVSILILILVSNGTYPTWSWVSALYYFVAMFVFLFGLGWLLSTLNVFLRDVGHMVGIVMQFGFWLTPIVWNYERIPVQWRFLLKLNPVFYITEGYRRSFLNQGGLFSESISSTLIFWALAFSVFVAGTFAYKRLRRHFADLL